MVDRHAAVRRGERGDGVRRAIGIGRIAHCAARRDCRRSEMQPARWSRQCCRSASLSNCARPSPWATATGRREPRHAGEQQRGRVQRSPPGLRVPRIARCGCAGSAANCCAPGIRSLSTANIWQPLQTPSEKVSGRSKKRWKSQPRALVKQDRTRPAAACAEHIAVGEAPTGDQPAEAGQVAGAAEQIRHVDIVGFEACAIERCGHFVLAVDTLFAQHRNAWARAARDHRSRDILVGIETQSLREARILLIEHAPRIPPPRSSDRHAGGASGRTSPTRRAANPARTHRARCSRCGCAHAAPPAARR